MDKDPIYKRRHGPEKTPTTETASTMFYRILIKSDCLLTS